jgi:hypothetical protein
MFPLFAVVSLPSFFVEKSSAAHGCAGNQFFLKKNLNEKYESATSR